MQNASKNGKVAAIWSSDGGDVPYLKYSIFSFEKCCKRAHDIVILCRKDVNLTIIERMTHIIRIDPTEILTRIGVKESEHFGKWRFPIFYKLAIPLIDQLRDYESVANFDSDILFIQRKDFTIDGLFDYPLHDSEVAGVPDLNLSSMRGGVVAVMDTPNDIKDELSERVWVPSGTLQRSYINVGVLRWNLSKIEIDWYERRIKAFWNQRIKPGNTRKYHFPEQDFINSMLRVDSGLASRYNCLCNRFYHEKDICARHYVGSHKKDMIELGRKTYGF